MARIFDLSGRRVWVAGHRGMVGSAISRALRGRAIERIEVDASQLDLRRQVDVERFMRETRPQVVFLAAARVGGIMANSAYPAEFIYDNLMIEANIIHGAHQVGVEKLMFLGSTCIYPRDAEQPLREESLLTGSLEPTNEWYAIAKIAGIKLCQAYRKQYGADYISAMPTNLYGPNDNFDPFQSHVLAALISKIHAAKLSNDSTVAIWGSGKPRREFMHVDDLACALLFLLEHYSDLEHVNIGTGVDCTITEAAHTIAGVVGYAGSFVYDLSKPDGTPRKCTDVSRLRALGFAEARSLEEGIRDMYAWYLANVAGKPSLAG